MPFVPADYRPRFAGGHWQTLFAWARRRDLPGLPDPVERLKACMARNIKLVTRGWSKEVTIILHEHDTLTGKAQAHINARKTRYVRFLESSFAEAVEKGLIRPVDPTVAAFSFLGMVLWIYKWFKPGGKRTDDEIAAGMVDLLFTGLQPAPRS